MKFVLEYEIGPMWATVEQLADMTEDEIIDLLQEDVTEVWLEGTKRVERAMEG